MPDAIARAATLLGLDPGFDGDAVRRAFRAAVRRGRPDLGAMAGERLAELLEARDALLAVAPATVRPAGPAGRGPSGPLASRFDVASRLPTGRLVDVLA